MHIAQVSIGSPAKLTRTAIEGTVEGTPDTALLKSIASGDRRAMHTLFTRHKQGVLRFLLAIGEDRSNAEDIVSDVFLDVWRQAGSFEGKCQVSTWLCAIARHKALAQFRRRPMDRLDSETAEAIEDPSDGPERTLHRKETSAILNDCLEQLPVRQREIISLVYYQQRTINEAARIARLPHNTVKTRMFYARRRIAEMLAARGIERA